MKKAIMLGFCKGICCFIVFFIISSPLYSQFSKNHLLFWVRSDTLLTTTGTSLNIWNDISGNNFNFSAISSPTVNTSNPSGFTSIFFNNSSLLSNNSTSITNFEAFIVFKKSGVVNTYERLIDHNYLDGFWIGRNNNISHNFGGGYKNATPPLGIFNNFPDSIANIMHVYKKQAIHSISNGLGPASSQTLSNSSPTALNKITIGCDLLQTGNLKGDIYEIIFFNDSIRNGVKDSVFNYLQNKYASPVDLGSDINVINSVCDTLLSSKGKYEKYLWSNGSSLPTTNVNKSGKYWLRGTDIFGKISSDTILVTYPGNFLTQNMGLCSGATYTWNTHLPKDQYTFQWQDNSTDSLLNITQGGQYYVKVTDNSGCSINSNTITITLDNFPITASLGPDDSVCEGNSITLTSGANQASTYLWNDGSTAPSLTITTSGQYSVVVTNTNNCVARDTINITILGKAPLADFSFSAGCRNSQINFTNLSIPPMGNIISNSEWNFGNLPSPSTSTLTNSFHTYSDTGSYTVKLTVFTDSGCKETITKTIHIAPTPTVNFSAGVSCQKDSTAFSNQSISSPGYSITAFNWNFGDMSSGSNLQNPKHVFSNQQNYNVKLVATNNAGCKDSLTNVVSVKAQVSASFTNSPACSNTATIFQDNSIVPAPSSSSTREWIFGGGIIRSGITVPMLYTLSGVYPVTLTVTGQNGCVSKISKLISVFNPPVVSFPVASFCSKDTISIANSSTAQSGIISSYNWKLNNTTFSTVQSPTLTSASAGTYSVRLTVVNSFGCKDSLTNPITVFPLPNVDFTTNPLSYYYIDSPVTFSPSIANANSYLWNISNFSPISIASPTVNFTTEGDYVVSLFLTNQQGCKNTKTKNITVSKRYLDLAILNVRTTKDANGFISVETDIANGGSVPINSIDINYQISDAGNIKETWNGTINPNAFYVYSFTAKSASNKSGTSNNITCVNIEKVNGQIDQNTSNNSLCNSLNTDAISVANPVPNPTSSDITLPVILNKDNEITITIYNSMGQVQYAETTQNGILGLNFITLPTDNYAKGCYIIKTVIDDEIFIKKFIKISNE
ncbi:MAG: PKD domain-containing protein [Bacteroidia bacterium]|nr:PKD domain-containing protein [Bacteroidia bacterium]